MSVSKSERVLTASVFAVDDGVSYTAVATAVPSSQPRFTVQSEFCSIPEARDLTWEDDFFVDGTDAEDVVAVFDLDYKLMEDFNTQANWVTFGATIFYGPLVFVACTLGGAPCVLRQNAQWNANCQHVAITRDGIRFVKARRPTCWGLPCTDAGKSSITVSFDKITDCDIKEPSGNTCCCIKNVLTVVSFHTASSGNNGLKELMIVGLKDPHAFKRLVWAMKRRGHAGVASVPSALEMVDRENDSADVTSLLKEIRDELREHNTLLKRMNDEALAAAAAATSGTDMNGSRHVSDRQQDLRHKQQRLLLFLHAAKCQHDDGRCPVTRHCAGMKRLWKHIAECKDQKCLVPHCVSSRYVLNHYHRCKDVRCPVCGPVREAIHRSHEKQKQMQALKQRHQQAVEQNQMAAGSTAAPAPAAASAALTQQGMAPFEQSDIM